MEINKVISLSLSNALSVINREYNKYDIDQFMMRSNDVCNGLLEGIGEDGLRFITEHDRYDITAKDLVYESAVGLMTMNGSSVYLDIQDCPANVWKNYYNAIKNEYVKIVSYAQAERNYREARKENRGRVIGGGFGLGGAIKGMAEAGAINILTGAAHSLYNSIENWGTDKNEIRNKENLYKSEQFLGTFYAGLAEAANVIKLRIISILGMGNFKDAQEETKKILVNVANGHLSEEASENAMIEAFTRDPFNLKIYRAWLEQCEDKDNMLQDMAAFFGLADDLRYIKSDIVLERTERKTSGYFIELQIKGVDCLEHAYGLNSSYPGYGAIEKDLRVISEEAEKFGLLSQIMPSKIKNIVNALTDAKQKQAERKKNVELIKNIVDILAIVIERKMNVSLLESNTIKENNNADKSKRYESEAHFGDINKDNNIIIKDISTHISELFALYQNNSLYFWDTSAKANEKIRKAMNAYGQSDTDESVICCYDNTVFGGADDGFILTNKRLYFHNFGEDKQLINYSDISKVEVYREGDKQRIKISKRDNTFILIQISYALDKIEEMKTMIEDVISRFVIENNEIYLKEPVQEKNELSDTPLTKDTNKKIKLYKFNGYLKGKYGEIKSVYWNDGSEESVDKIQKAINSYANGANIDTVILCQLDTDSSKGDKGWLVTNEVLYLRDDEGRIKSVNWSNVSFITLDEGFFNDSVNVICKNSDKIKMATRWMNRDSRRVFVKVLDEIQGKYMNLKNLHE